MNDKKKKKEETIYGIKISDLEKERKEWQKLFNCSCKEVRSCTCLIFRYE